MRANRTFVTRLQVVTYRSFAAEIVCQVLFVCTGGQWLALGQYSQEETKAFDKQSFPSLKMRQMDNSQRYTTPAIFSNPANHGTPEVKRIHHPTPVSTQALDPRPATDV